MQTSVRLFHELHLTFRVYSHHYLPIHGILLGYFAHLLQNSQNPHTASSICMSRNLFRDSQTVPATSLFIVPLSERKALRSKRVFNYGIHQGLVLTSVLEHIGLLH